MDGAKPTINRTLEEASDVVRWSKGATANAEPSEGYKRKQIEKLKEYATLVGADMLSETVILQR